MPKANAKLTTFRCFFNTTALSTIPDTFVDSEMYVEFGAPDMDAVAPNALGAFTHELFSKDAPPALTKIQLTRIVSMDGPPLVRVFLPTEEAEQVRMCRVCGCTDDDCQQCINRSGAPCAWVEREKNLCSVCTSLGKTRRP